MKNFTTTFRTAEVGLGFRFLNSKYTINFAKPPIKKLTRYKFSPRVSADKILQSHSIDYSKVFGTIFQLLWRVQDEEVFDGTWVRNLQWFSPTDRNYLSMAHYWNFGILISVHQFASIIFYGFIINVINYDS